MADAVAAASVYAIENNTDRHAIEWRELIPDIAIFGSLMPDYEHVDLEKLEVQRNAVVLIELHKRATSNLPLLDNIGDYIDMISHGIVHHGLEINA